MCKHKKLFGRKCKKYLEQNQEKREQAELAKIKERHGKSNTYL